MTAQQETDRRRAHAASVALQARIKKENAAHDAQQARLIAAAPDLLAALQEIDKRFSMCATAGLSASDAYDSYFQCMAQSAIAKATGGTP